ncbi:MAG: hypothetical protein RLZZ50_1717 [Verrucomicrobiota bacterium]
MTKVSDMLWAGGLLLLPVVLGLVLALLIGGALALWILF